MTNSIPALFTLISLNLHGYHPMNESLRFREARDGSMSLAPSDIYFFNPEEFMRGENARSEQLATYITQFKPLFSEN